MVVKIIVVVAGWILLDVIVLSPFLIKGFREYKREKECAGCLYNDFRIKSGFTKEYCKSCGCFKIERGYDYE